MISLRKQGGFSLIELLVSMVLLIILVVIANSRSGHSFQQQQLAVCNRNLQSMYIALSLYKTEKSVYPQLAGAQSSESVLSQLVPKYTTMTEYFICPGTKASALPQGKPFPDQTIDYACYSGWATNANVPLVSDRQVDAKPKRAAELVFSLDGKGPGSNHNKYGGNILMSDGSVFLSPPRLKVDLWYESPIVLLQPKPR
jgi:prepilin-type N-terminal cleavage/methylation domain-containing protein